MRSQVSIEYLIIAGIGVIIVILASAAFLNLMNYMIDEYNSVSSYENNVLEVLRG